MLWFAVLAVSQATTVMERSAERLTYFGECAKRDKALYGPPAADDFDFIDNGVIKVGILKSAGGTIGYISDSHNDDNVINIADMGREVQLSYYADPANYMPDKCGASTPWGQPWSWNPIGAGDVYKNRAQVLSYNNTGTSISLVMRPLQWACDNVPCECEFEVTYTLANNGVHMVATLRNHRTDGVVCTTPHSQEEPAVYTNGILPNLVSYTGNAPWTLDSNITVFPHPSGPPWVPGIFTATEHWAAWVRSDLNSFGLGVYTPATDQYLAGYHGKRDGTGGPHDDQTGYMAPLETQVLTSDVVYTYEAYLILGNLPDIRSYVYALHR